MPARAGDAVADGAADESASAGLGATGSAAVHASTAPAITAGFEGLAAATFASGPRAAKMSRVRDDVLDDLVKPAAQR